MIAQSENDKMTCYPHPRIQVITRDCPVENSSGAKAYLLDILAFLKRNGFEIELTILNASLGGRSPVFMISKMVARLAYVAARGNVKVGPFLVRLSHFTDIFIIPLGLIYFLMPEAVRAKFLNACHYALEKAKKRFGLRLSHLDRKPRIKDYPVTKNEKKFFHERFQDFKPDILMVNYVWLTEILDILPPNRSIISVLLTHEIIHQRVENARKYDIAWGYANWKQDNETRLLRKADILLAIHEEDKKTLKRMVPEAEVLSLPISAITRMHSVPQVGGRCLFVGSDGEPNIHGLTWFLNHVWPVILVKMPRCSLHICGTVCRKIDGRYKNVKLLGKINNLEPEYSAAEVCLIPLLFGSGLKIKLFEALSHGRASVSTSIGIQGIPEIEGQAVLVSDSSEDFALAVCSILKDKNLRKRMEKKACAYVKENLSPEIVYRPLAECLNRHLRENINTK